MSSPLRLIGYNTQYCTGHDGVTDPARIAREIAAGDIVALQEIDRFWARTGHLDQAEALAAALPDRYWVYGAGYDMDASRVEAGRVENRRRQFGNMILSRWPILMARNHLLPKLHLSGPMSLQRSALEAVIETPLGALRIFSIHLAHAAAPERRLQILRLLEILEAGGRDGGACSGRDLPKGWSEGAPALAAALAPAPAMPPATVMLGDFNMLPASPEHALIAGESDPIFGPLEREDGLIDAWQSVGAGPGHTFEDANGARRLDYAFCSAALRSRLGEMRVLTDATGSDHLPVALTLR